MNVLVIDDTMAIVELFRGILIRGNHEMDFALDGDKGLALTKKTQYDIIFVDHNMPQMTGLELIKKIKENQKNSAKIVMITGDILMTDFLADFVGADAFIKKPFTISDIESVMPPSKNKS